MLSIEYIQSQAVKAARRARRAGEEPKVPTSTTEASQPAFCTDIPFLGTYVPKGWSKVGEDLFVDSSGFGAPGEPALTIQAFLRTVRENIPQGYGYAITQAGQFQVYVGVYKRD